MKLTKNQIEALYILHEEKLLDKDGCKIHNNTMNSLYFKKLIQLSSYANGDFWEMTDAGLNFVELREKFSK